MPIRIGKCIGINSACSRKARKLSIVCDLIAKYEGAAGHAMLEAESAARRRRSSVKENETSYPRKPTTHVEERDVVDSDRGQNQSSRRPRAQASLLAADFRQGVGILLLLQQTDRGNAMEAPKGFFAQEEGEEETTARRAKRKFRQTMIPVRRPVTLRQKARRSRPRRMCPRNHNCKGTKKVEKEIKGKGIPAQKSTRIKEHFSRAAEAMAMREGKTTKKSRALFARSGQ